VEEIDSVWIYNTDDCIMICILQDRKFAIARVDQDFDVSRIPTLWEKLEGKKKVFRTSSSFRIVGRDAPDTVFAGYPANPKAGYRISGKGRIPDIRPDILPDILPDNWLDNYRYSFGKISNKFIKTALKIIIIIYLKIYLKIIDFCQN
jgi:hypothetical protein